MFKRLFCSGRLPAPAFGMLQQRGSEILSRSTERSALDVNPTNKGCGGGGGGNGADGGKYEKSTGRAQHRGERILKLH